MLTLFKKPEVYDTCNTTSMAAFVSAITVQDLSGLIKFGKPTATQLSTAWDKVFNEYLTLAGDTQVSQLLSLLKEIATLTNRLQLIELLVSELAERHSTELADQLRKLGFRFQYEPGEGLMRELELTIVQAKQQLIRLNQTKDELKQLQEDSPSKVTAQDYEDQLSELSKFQGYPLPPESTTVAQYCSILKRYKNYYKPNVGSKN